MADARLLRCCHCGRPMPPHAMLRVTNRASGRHRYVCRPTRGTCFRFEVRGVGLEIIAPADPAAERYALANWPDLPAQVLDGIAARTSHSARDFDGPQRSSTRPTEAVATWGPGQ